VRLLRESARRIRALTAEWIRVGFCQVPGAEPWVQRWA
jgi:hypothetical protein